MPRRNKEEATSCSCWGCLTWPFRVIFSLIFKTLKIAFYSFIFGIVLVVILQLFLRYFYFRTKEKNAASEDFRDQIQIFEIVWEYSKLFGSYAANGTMWTVQFVKLIGNLGKEIVGK